MNDQPEMPAEQPEQPQQPEQEQVPGVSPEQQDKTLFDLNAELAKLIEQEQIKQSQPEQPAVTSGTGTDPLGNPRNATLNVSHDELHALGTGVKMLYQFCAMALIQGKNSPDEVKEWRERQDTLLGLKELLTQQHEKVFDGTCSDDDDDECDHDH